MSDLVVNHRRWRRPAVSRTHHAVGMRGEIVPALAVPAGVVAALASRWSAHACPSGIETPRRRESAPLGVWLSALLAIQPVTIASRRGVVSNEDRAGVPVYRKWSHRGGIEPPTYCLQGRCSTTELRRRVVTRLSFVRLRKPCASSSLESKSARRLGPGRTNVSVDYGHWSDLRGASRAPRGEQSGFHSQRLERAGRRIL